VLWPKKDKGKYGVLFDSVYMMVNSLEAITLLLTFGLTSPPLAVIVGAYLISQTILWQILLGRYLHLHPDGVRSRDINQGARKDLTLGGSVDCSGGLEESCLEVWKGPMYSLKLVLLSSSIFLGIIILDILHDKASLEDSAWAPALIVGVALLLLLGNAIPFAFHEKRGVAYSSQASWCAR